VGMFLWGGNMLTRTTAWCAIAHLFPLRAYDWIRRNNRHDWSGARHSASPEQPPEAVRRLKVSKVGPPRESKLGIGREYPVGATGPPRAHQPPTPVFPRRGSLPDDTPQARRCAQSRGLRRLSASFLLRERYGAVARTHRPYRVREALVVTIGANSARVLQFNDFRQSPHAGTADGST
jgi:hypothetical protein